MKMLDIPLKAGMPWTIGRGRFVRVFDALYPITIKTQALNGKSNQETKLIANMGAEFVQFEKADIVSEHDQIIRIAYSELNIFDNRLGLDEATKMQVVSPQVVRTIDSFYIPNAERYKILDADVKRKKALIACRVECKFFTEETGNIGFTIDGDFDDYSNTELWVEAADGTTAIVDVMGFYYE